MLKNIKMNDIKIYCRGDTLAHFNRNIKRFNIQALISDVDSICNGKTKKPSTPEYREIKKLKTEEEIYSSLVDNYNDQYEEPADDEQLDAFELQAEKSFEKIRKQINDDILTS
jgi:hypothetical protein